MKSGMIAFYPHPVQGFDYSGKDRTLRYKDIQGNDVTVTAPEGHELRFSVSLEGMFFQAVPREDVKPTITDQLIGKRVSLKVGRVTHGTGKIPGGVQQIAKPQPACKHEWIDSEGRTSSGVLCQKCGAYDLPAPPTGPNPIDQALIDAARMTRQKFCPHETVLAGVCIACDKRVKHGQS